MKKAFLVSVASLLLMGVCSCSTVGERKRADRVCVKRGLLSMWG